MGTGAKELTGKHVLFIAVGLFGIVLAVNVVFIVLSLRTFTGEEVPDAYTRGLAYNDVLAEREAQADLGWMAGIATAAGRDGITRVTVRVTDAAGRPLSGATVSLLFRRATHAGEDTPLTLAEISPGNYTGEVALPGEGMWDVRGHVARGETERLDFEDRLWLE